MASSASILVVDDDVDACRNLSDILSDLGYEVDVAHDGAAALELVRKNPYDVALLDFKMPGMTGLELYREIRKLRAGTVAIIVSAYTNASTKEEALGAGAWQVLAKPVDFPRLLGLVDEALDQPLVMVVDDDPDLCKNLWDLFRDQGYRVCLAHTVTRASQQASERNHKVILIDMRLPDGDGVEVFQAVRQVNPDAHTVIITGHPRETNDMVDRLLQEGADAICFKPFDIPGLMATVDRLSKTQEK